MPTAVTSNTVHNAERRSRSAASPDRSPGDASHLRDNVGSFQKGSGYAINPGPTAFVKQLNVQATLYDPEPWEMTRDAFVDFARDRLVKASNKLTWQGVLIKGAIYPLPQGSQRRGRLIKPLDTILKKVHREAVSSYMWAWNRGRLPNALPHEKRLQKPSDEVLRDYPELNEAVQTMDFQRWLKAHYVNNFADLTEAEQASWFVLYTETGKKHPSCFSEVVKNQGLNSMCLLEDFEQGVVLSGHIRKNSGVKKSPETPSCFLKTVTEQGVIAQSLLEELQTDSRAYDPETVHEGKQDQDFRRQARTAYRNLVNLLLDAQKKGVIHRATGYGMVAVDVPVITDPISGHSLMLRLKPDGVPTGFGRSPKSGRPIIEIAVPGAPDPITPEWAQANIHVALDLIEDSFFHEFIHYLDDVRSGTKTAGAAKKFDAGDEAAYFNTPSEYNAYFQEAANRYFRRIDKITGAKNSERKFGILIGNTAEEFITAAVRDFAKTHDATIRKFWSLLTSKNERKIKKRLYQLWLDLVQYAKDKGVISQQFDEAVMNEAGKWPYEVGIRGGNVYDYNLEAIAELRGGRRLGFEGASDILVFGFKDSEEAVAFASSVRRKGYDVVETGMENKQFDGSRNVDVKESFLNVTEAMRRRSNG